MARLRRPAPTIRLRLTLLFGLTFLVTGAVLLSIGYALVRHNLDSRPGFPAGQLRKLGLTVPRAAPPPGVFPFRRGSSEFRVAEAVRHQLRADALHRLLAEYLLALVVMSTASVAAGWWLAGRALAPLREITATARRVSGENLRERIGLVGPADELKELADTFDGMLGRLDGAFASQRHFVANASHELRTPLAIMRTEIDVTLADPRARPDELRAMGEALRETIDRCERMIESLLMLARSEAAVGREEDVELAAMAGDCLTDLQLQIDSRGVRVSSDLRAAPVHGEPALLERMTANLITNAIRHNEPGGWLSVSTESGGGSVRLTVGNGGPMIDPEVVSELTQPFRRLQRHGEGVGLGLSIVRSVATAHGGELRLSVPPSGGLLAEVTLPHRAHQLAYGELTPASLQSSRSPN